MLLVAIGVSGAAVWNLHSSVSVGDLLVPLTAAQLLWINVIADGPPALALGLDRNSDVMRRGPRSPPCCSSRAPSQHLCSARSSWHA